MFSTADWIKDQDFMGTTAVAADAGISSEPNLIFGSGGSVIPDKAIIHDDDTFAVQWSAFNQGLTDCPAFTDLLVITRIPEGCPGSDDQEHPVVYDSGKDGNPQNFAEGPLSDNTNGPLNAANGWTFLCRFLPANSDACLGPGKRQHV